LTLRPNQVPLGRLINTDSNTFGTYASSSDSSEVGARTGLVTPLNYENLQMPTKSTGQAASSELDHNSCGQLKSADQLDFTNSIDTDVNVRWAPAVTHETVRPQIRNVREEQVTRAIHNHDVFHRILPIKQVEVLPARHFRRSPSTGDLKEIPAPKASHKQQNWQVVETSPGRSSLQPMGSPPYSTQALQGNDEKDELSEEDGVTRADTPRSLTIQQGAHKEYVGEDGIPRTETTWIHPPTIEEGAQRTGQTKPLDIYMDDARHPIPEVIPEDRRVIPGGWADGVIESDTQFCNGHCGMPDKDKQLRRRPVGSQVGSPTST
jgi:hypothetical protein